MGYLSTLLSQWPKNICETNTQTSKEIRINHCLVITTVVACCLGVVIKLLLHWGLSQKEIYKRVFAYFLSFKKALWMKIENFARLRKPMKLLWTKNEFLHKPGFFQKISKNQESKFLEGKSQGVFPTEVREGIVSHQIFQILLHWI